MTDKGYRISLVRVAGESAQPLRPAFHSADTLSFDNEGEPCRAFFFGDAPVDGRIYLAAIRDVGGLPVAFIVNHLPTLEEL